MPAAASAVHRRRRRRRRRGGTGAPGGGGGAARAAAARPRAAARRRARAAGGGASTDRSGVAARASRPRPRRRRVGDRELLALLDADGDVPGTAATKPSRERPQQLPRPPLAARARLRARRARGHRPPTKPRARRARRRRRGGAARSRIWLGRGSRTGVAREGGVKRCYRADELAAAACFSGDVRAACRTGVHTLGQAANL